MRLATTGGVLHRHHPQPAQPQRRAGAFRSRRSLDDLRRARRVQRRRRRARAATCSAPRWARTAWTDISPALNLPFNALALDGAETPTTIYAGTDFGVLRSVDRGATWTILDDIHFPRVPVLDLVLRAGVLRAATYGRGVFQFVQPAAPGDRSEPSERPDLRDGLHRDRRS